MKKSRAWAAWEMKTFVPSSSQPPSTFVAVVSMLPRSVPPRGSVRQAEQTVSPRAMPGSQRSFCAFVPKRSSEPATREEVDLIAGVAEEIFIVERRQRLILDDEDALDDLLPPPEQHAYP